MLDMFFNPKAVAVIGASRDSAKLGYGVLNNILNSGYPGQIYPINPKSAATITPPRTPANMDKMGLGITCREKRVET